jgi:hypothetical protein
VNLWGLEGPPSLDEREEKLESDVKKIDDFTTIIEKLDQKVLTVLPKHLISETKWLKREKKY